MLSAISFALCCWRNSFCYWVYVLFCITVLPLTEYQMSIKRQTCIKAFWRSNYFSSKALSLSIFLSIQLTVYYNNICSCLCNIKESTLKRLKYVERNEALSLTFLLFDLYLAPNYRLICLQVVRLWYKEQITFAVVERFNNAIQLLNAVFRPFH